MGKVPSRVQFDEDGLPIPQTVKTQKIQFDEDGLPIPVKKKEGSDLSMVGGQAVQPPSQGGGQVGSSKAQYGGLTDYSIKGVEKYAEQYNKQFEDATGHREFSLSAPIKPKSILGQQGYEKRKAAFELKKMEQYRDIEENKIKPVQIKAATGEVKPSELSELYNTPFGKKIVGQIINDNVPELGSAALESDVFGNEQKWENIAHAINVKNIGVGIDLNNQMYKSIDDYLNTAMQSAQLKRSYAGSVSPTTGIVSREAGSELIPTGKYDVNNPQELGKFLQEVTKSDDVVGADGGKKKLVDSIKEKLRLIKTQQPIDDEINNANISDAITRVNMRLEKGRQNVKYDDKINELHFKLGLNYVKDSDPALYANVMRTINKLGDIPDKDYEGIASLGQDIYNKKIYLESGNNPELVGKQTDIKYTSYQSEKQKYSEILSEEIKRLGYGNKGRVPTKAIEQAWRLHPELDNAELVNDIAKDEAAGGYGIVKSGWLTKRMNAIAEPFKDINRFYNAIVESPAETYYNSRRLDYGDQQLEDKEGNVINRLPSEKYGTFDKILDGALKIASQVALTKGVGAAIKAPISFGFSQVPRAALTVNQARGIVNAGGTFASTYLQTYGNSYIDFLDKTGNPDKAALMATIDGLGTAALETFISPDVKISDKAAELLKSKKIDFVKDINKVLEGEGGKIAVGQVVKKFVSDAGGIMAGQIAQEDLQQIENFLVEGIFSPRTVKERDLGKELWNTTKETALATVIPMILGGGGATKAARKLSREGLHTIAINFDSYKEAMDNAVANGSMSQQDYDLASSIIQRHKYNIDNAPHRDAKGGLISADRQLEYAFQTTVEQIYSDKAAQQTDKVQREPLEEKIKEAEDIKRKIFNGEQVKDLPKDEDTKPDDKVAEENRLLEIADQALNRVAGTIGEGENAIKISDEVSLKRAIETFGEKDVKAAINLTMQKELEANQTELDTIENPTEGDIEYYKETENEIKQKYQAITEQISQPIELSVEPTDVLGKEVGSGVGGDVKLIEDSEKWYKAEKKITDKDGNEITLTIDKNKEDKHFYIKAKDVNGKEIGSALFETSNGKVWSGNEIEVKESNRRKGVMSAMYDFAESEGHPLEPTKTLSKEGKEFWNNRKQSLPTQEAVGELPPTVPPEPPKEDKADSGDKGLNDKGVLTHLYNAKNVPEASKEGFKREGLKYETKSQQEAEAVAKGIIEEMGLDGALAAAEAMKFDGDVNSLIFGIALNRLAEENNAEKFAEVGIVYDKMARYGGRFNAAINYFYKKSPLGIVLMENAKIKEDFDEWSKNKQKSWKEGLDELMKDPEFKKLFDERVEGKVKEERKETRKAKREKVHKAIDDTMAKWAKKFSANLPEGTKKAGASIDVFKAAATAMKKAYDAGEAIGKVIQDAIDYITKETGVTDWDKDGFAKEWAERLTEKGGKVITDEELKSKVLNRFRKRLKGLTEKQKDNVIQKSYNELIENDALNFDDLRQIIAEVIGKKELTEEEQVRMKELVTKVNSIEKAAEDVRTERTEEARQRFRDIQKEASFASKELNTMFYSKPDIIKRLNSIMVLGTLGPVSLVVNVTYNIWNQLALRFPIGVYNTLLDLALTKSAKLSGSEIHQEYNVIKGQAEFWSKLGTGVKESFEQITTGLNRMDYTQKEVYSEQIRPFDSLKDLWKNFKGETSLTRSQWWDKFIQGFPLMGMYAEGVARMLNIGDKPQRFAAQGAQAASFAKGLGLKGIDYDIFIDFPRAEAYRVHKALGKTDEQAMAEADVVERAIIREGERATFQQDNLLNDKLSQLFGGKNSGIGGIVKSLTISPYVKIPSNAFWSYYNLINPEIAAVQTAFLFKKAHNLRMKGELSDARMAAREARYWMAHMMVGIAMRSVVLSMVKSGVFIPATDEDDSKKEREAISFYDKAGTVEINGVKISNKWFAQFGMMGNAISKKYRDMTPEQKENQETFWNTIFGGMEADALKELENGIFANSSSLLQWYSTGNPDRYLMNTINLLSNILQPAGIAQVNRARVDYVTSAKGDTFIEKLNQNFAQRSTMYRRLFDVQLEYKRDIWGQKIPKDGNTLSRMFGVSKENPKLFARPVYDDYLRTMDAGFLPPTVPMKLNGKLLNTEQYDKFQDYVGSSRMKYIEPYVSGAIKLEGFDEKYSDIKSDKKKKFALDYWYEKGLKEGKLKFYKEFPEFAPIDEPIDYYEEVQKDIFKTLQNLK